MKTSALAPDGTSDAQGLEATPTDAQASDGEHLARIAEIVGDLPTLPDVALRAMRLAEKPEWDLRELEDVMGRDSGLSARFLRLANSAFFGARGTVSTLDQAILRVGITRLRSLLLTAALDGFHDVKRSNFAKAVLWDHALATACVSQHLATTHRRCVPDEAFVAGLLHDIGRTVMDQVLSTEYADVLALVETEGATSWLSAEQRVFGFDHTHLGFVVANAWEFPPAIAETIRFHHDPAQASTDRGLCATVSLANSLCVKAALGPDQQPDLDLETLLSATMLELDPDQLEELMQQHARIVRLVWSG